MQIFWISMDIHMLKLPEFLSSNRQAKWNIQSVNTSAREATAFMTAVLKHCGNICCEVHCTRQGLATSRNCYLSMTILEIINDISMRSVQAIFDDTNPCPLACSKNVIVWWCQRPCHPFKIYVCVINEHMKIFLCTCVCICMCMHVIKYSTASVACCYA